MLQKVAQATQWPGVSDHALDRSLEDAAIDVAPVLVQGSIKDALRIREERPAELLTGIRLVQAGRQQQSIDALSAMLRCAPDGQVAPTATTLAVAQWMAGDGARANAALDGRARVLIGGGDLVVSPGFVPQIRLADVILTAPGGRQLVAVADLRTALDGQGLLRGQLLPSRLTLRGAHVAIQRRADGTLDVAPAAKGFSGARQSPGQILDAVVGAIPDTPVTLKFFSTLASR